MRQLKTEIQFLRGQLSQDLRPQADRTGSSDPGDEGDPMDDAADLIMELNRDWEEKFQLTFGRMQSAMETRTGDPSTLFKVPPLPR